MAGLSITFLSLNGETSEFVVLLGQLWVLNMQEIKIIIVLIQEAENILDQVD